MLVFIGWTQGQGASPFMWKIVILDEKSHVDEKVLYMVDITW